MKRPQLAGALTLVCLLGGLAHPASPLALGIRLPDQDAFATARGNAFVATANDPSAIYYNPAGITQLDGSNVSLGMYGITLPRVTPAPPVPPSTASRIGAALPQTFSTLSLTNYHLPLAWAFIRPTGCHGMAR